MNPIISPTYFYLIGASNSAYVAFGCLCFLSCVAFVFFGWVYGASVHEHNTNRRSWGEDEVQQLEHCWRSMAVSAVLAIVFGLLCLLLPSETTAYQMLAASIITPDNISAVGGSIESIIEHIINLSQQITP